MDYSSNAIMALWTVLMFAQLFLPVFSDENFTSHEDISSSEYFLKPNETIMGNYELSTPEQSKMGALERQKKEGSFGDDDTRFRYRPNDLWKKWERLTTTSTTQQSITVEIIKVRVPTVEKILQRYLIDDDKTSQVDIFSTTPTLKKHWPTLRPLLRLSTTTRKTRPRLKNPLPGQQPLARPALTPENFDEIVTNGNSPWIIQFYSTACQDCDLSLKNLTDYMELLPKDVKIATVNVAYEQGFIEKFNLTILPSIQVFYPKGGRKIEVSEEFEKEDTKEIDISSTEKFAEDAIEWPDEKPRKHKKILKFNDIFFTSDKGELMPIIKATEPTTEKSRNDGKGGKVAGAYSDADSKSLSDGLKVVFAYILVKKLFKFVLIFLLYNRRAA